MPSFPLRLYFYKHFRIGASCFQFKMHALTASHMMQEAPIQKQAHFETEALTCG